MITMLGMMKWSALNIVRYRPEIISPEILWYSLSPEASCLRR